MKKTVAESINMTLSKTAEKVASRHGCIMFWGETKVPACLKAEVKRNQMKK